MKKRVLMVRPTFFSVDYVINAHMVGNIGLVDKEKALQEWRSLRNVYQKLGLNVTVLEGIEGLPDMVFTANQSFPFPDGSKRVLLSRMFATERQAEVQYFADFYTQLGYEVHHLPENIQGSFEGMGDALFQPESKRIFGGYGFRTSLGVYDWMSENFGFEIVPIELKHAHFYHLDTCLSILDEHTALAYKEAFEPAGWKQLHDCFQQIIEVPHHEAQFGFACNAHSPDGKHVILQHGNHQTCNALKQHGYEPIEVETAEFMKSGGSVFCIKMIF